MRVRIPALCSNCGLSFPSGFAMRSGTSVKLNGFSTRCPNCKTRVVLPSGLYSALGAALEFVISNLDSREVLQEYYLVLQRFNEANLNEVESLTYLKEYAPKLEPVIRPLITERTFWILGVVISVLLFWIDIQIQYSAGLSEAELANAFEQALIRVLERSQGGLGVHE